MIALIILTGAGLYTHWKEDCLSTLEAGSGLALLAEGLPDRFDLATRLPTYSVADGSNH